MARVALRFTQATACMHAVVPLHRTARGGVFRPRMAVDGKPTRLTHVPFAALESRQAFYPTFHGAWLASQHLRSLPVHHHL